MQFKKAKRESLYGRIALCGPSGSGKTFSALKLASTLGNKIAVIDTEYGSASRYADRFQFDVLELDEHSPLKYVNAIDVAEANGYDVIVVDSLSHAWAGQDGALELADKETARSKSGNSYVAWRNVTPLHNKLVNRILSCEAHVICTMRTKTEYSQERNDQGRTVIKKVGLAPIQRAGIEYEFDIVADIDIDHNFIVSKSRFDEVSDMVVNKIDEKHCLLIKNALSGGGDAPPRARLIGQSSFVSAEQCDVLKNLIAQADDTEESFCMMAKIKKIDELEEARFANAVKALENRIKRKNQGGPSNGIEARNA